MLKILMTRHATTLTTTLFAVSAVSGVFLFFHSAEAVFKEMHEWLSMVLLVPVAFHVAKNWRSFIGYFRNRSIYMPLAASFVAAVVFGAATAGGGGSPIARVFGALEQATIAELAPVFDKTPDELVAHLKNSGFTVASAEETLAAVGEHSGVDRHHLIEALTGGR